MARIKHRSGFGAAIRTYRSSRRRRKDAALITDARGSRIRNYDHRRHVYAILQWSRIPLLLLSGALYLQWNLPWLAAILMIVSVPMPWIAVVIANGVGEPEDKRHPRVYKPAVVREQNRRWAEQQRNLALRDTEALALAGGEDNHSTDTGNNRSAAEVPVEPIIIDMPGSDDSSSRASS